VTTNTPRNPNVIAHQRRQPKCSPRNGPERIATRNGVENMIAVAWSSCNQRSAQTISSDDDTNSSERPSCSQGRDVFISPGRDTGLNMISATRNPPV
jgi:hypothetical protein